MTSSMDTMIAALYQGEKTEGVEKTAEAAMLSALEGEENPFQSMNLDQLIKVAGEMGVLDEDAPAFEGTEDAQVVRGTQMAYAFVHELGLAKEAMVAGKCRICKVADQDVEGQTVCSACSPSGG